MLVGVVTGDCVVEVVVGGSVVDVVVSGSVVGVAGDGRVIAVVPGSFVDPAFEGCFVVVVVVESLVDPPFEGWLVEVIVQPSPVLGSQAWATPLATHKAIPTTAKTPKAQSVSLRMGSSPGSERPRPLHPTGPGKRGASLQTLCATQPVDVHSPPENRLFLEL